MNIKLVGTLILIGLAAIFIIQNVTVVEIHFLFWKLSMSRSLFMIFLLLVGIAAGWMAHSYHIHRKRP